MEIRFSIFLNFFDVISMFFDVFSMFCLSISCLFYIFAFRCFVDLCFVIDPNVTLALIIFYYCINTGAARY